MDPRALLLTVILLASLGACYHIQQGRAVEATQNIALASEVEVESDCRNYLDQGWIASQSLLEESIFWVFGDLPELAQCLAGTIPELGARTESACREGHTLEHALDTALEKVSEDHCADELRAARAERGEEL